MPKLVRFARRVEFQEHSLRLWALHDKSARKFRVLVSVHNRSQSEETRMCSHRLETRFGNDKKLCVDGRCGLPNNAPAGT